MVRYILFYAQSLAGGFFLWLGLYIITRGITAKEVRISYWRSPAFAAGLGIALASWYMFGIAIGSVTTDKESYVLWERITWWAVPISMALWFRSILLLPDKNKKEVKPRWLDRFKQIACALVTFYGLFLAIVSTFTDFLFRRQDTYTQPTSLDNYFVPPRLPQYHLFSLFLMLTLWGAVLLLLYRYKTHLQDSQRGRENHLLTFGGAILAVGATISVVGYDNMSGQIPQQLGAFVMTIGLAIIGRGVLNHNALVQGRIYREDFKRSFWGVAIAVGFYLFLFHSLHLPSAVPMSPVTVPLLVYLAAFSFTSLRWTQWLVDKWVLSDWRAGFFLQINEVQREIMTAPDQQEALGIAQKELTQITKTARTAQTRDVIQQEIQIIFRHKAFQKDEVMANSKLLTLDLVQQALDEFARQNNLMPVHLSEGEKARVLRHFLEQYVRVELQPDLRNMPPNPPSDKWIEYLILSKSYLEDKTRTEVIAEIHRECGIRLAGNGGTGGRVYARHLENARQNLAHKLWQDELRAKRVGDSLHFGHALSFLRR